MTYIGSSGTTLYIRTGIDLTDVSITSFSIKVLKPNNTEVTWNAIIDPSNDTQMKYVILDTDIDIAGTYRIQSYVETATEKFLGDTTSFIVKDKFN